MKGWHQYSCCHPKLTEHLLWGRHCMAHLYYMNSFGPHSSMVRDDYSPHK